MKVKRLAWERRRVAALLARSLMTNRRKRGWLIFVLSVCSSLLSITTSAEPLMRVVRSTTSGTDLIQNGDFEQTAEGKLRGWTAAPQGFVIAAGQGKAGSQAVRCDSSDARGWYGVSQSVVLNQSSVLPLVVHGWSKAENVSGGSDGDYSLYVDLLYTDGTPLWGQTANFRVGTHGWERRELVILPEKPVKSLTLHCLFRNHSGQAWFDDVSLTELRTEGSAVLFQGVPIVPEKSRKLASAVQKGQSIITQDGLRLKVEDNKVSSLTMAGKELLASEPSGFLVRDVATNSDFYGFEKGSCPELGLKLQAHYTSVSNHIVIEGRLSDVRGRDRAVTLVFALPLDASGWRWGDDIRHSRFITGQSDFSKMVSIKCGATGTVSLYPLAAISSENGGLALALDMAQPAQYRAGYNAGTKQLYIAYDLGLVPETEHFPGSADFRFVLYQFDSRWGFRAAFQKLTEIFPAYFEVRSKDQGIWMPFTDIATVQGWEDFGFKYHEGNNNVPWDDEHGVLSFRYTEPMTWWMRMPKEIPRTISQAVWLRDELERGQDKSQRSMAQVSQVAAMYDESGQPNLLFRNEPWCNGAVWSLNPNPYLPRELARQPGEIQTTGAPHYNAATVHWNESTRESLYGPAAKGKLDGEYLDSLEGYVTADLNFRRDHFRHTTVPLTFSSDSKQPALFKGLAVFEFTKWFCGEVHQLNKLTFANGVPYRFTYLCPWLDVLGTETDWVRNGKYAPASDDQMSLWRTMSGAKPYLLLMNTDYDVFTTDMVERYFQRCLFYGMFPGMFSHNAAENPYWQNPKWYNRDRPLFKRYLPLIKRVAEAGWQPVTQATCDNANIFVERFGPDRDGKLYFTLFNDTGSQQSGRMRIDTGELGVSGRAQIRELLSSAALEGSAELDMALQPQEAKLIEFQPGR